MLKKLLEKDPNKRITAENALLHTWIVQKVTIKAITKQMKLYPLITNENKHNYEKLLNKLNKKPDCPFVFKGDEN